MSNTIQLYYVDAKTKQKVKYGKEIATKLSAANMSKVFTFNDTSTITKTANAPKKLFGFNQSEITVSKNLCSKVYNAIVALMQRGGKKDVLDDADFTPDNSGGNCEDDKWHNDSCDGEELNNLDYHNNNTFFHIK